MITVLIKYHKTVVNGDLKKNKVKLLAVSAGCKGL